MEESAGSGGKGSLHAKKPREISKKGWKSIALRVIDNIKTDHIQVVSAGVAFYFFLAVFPMIAAAVSVYGLVMEPAEVQDQMAQMAAVLPEQAHQMITDILSRMAEKSGQTLGLSLVISTFLSLWSANQGISALFEGVNIAYNEIDERNFFKKTGITLLFTLGAIIMGLLSITFVAVFPAIVGHINLPSVIETLTQWLRWPILGVILIFAFGAVYKTGPDRKSAEFRWVSYGAIVATVLWILGSLLFALYMNNFGNYDETYGSFAAVIILMLWFFITAFIILTGAEINAEMEHQTKMDTTTGESKPMGNRDAYYADHVADKKNK